MVRKLSCLGFVFYDATYNAAHTGRREKNNGGLQSEFSNSEAVSYDRQKLHCRNSLCSTFGQGVIRRDNCINHPHRDVIARLTKFKAK